MKPSSGLSSVASALLAALVTFGASTAAQTPKDPSGENNTARDQQSYPAPTNLKVLPKQITGKQLHDIMEKWTLSLGVECGACHTNDPGHVGPDGKPSLKFADDSKPMKEVARSMYIMTEGINTNYISKLEGSGMPTTCGTCHRGRISPEPYDPTAQQTKCPPVAPPPDDNSPAPQPANP